MSTSEQVPLEVLFGNPERVSPRISPDGTRLAWLAPDDGVMNVWLAEVGAGSDGARVVTNDRDRGIREYFWAHDNRHLLYVQDKGGDENWRLYGVDLAAPDAEVRDLTPFDGVQTRVDALDKRHPDAVLVGLNNRDPALHDVYRLTLSTGVLDLVLENPGFAGVVADTSLVVRAGAMFRDDGGVTIMVRDDGDSEWRPLLEVSEEDALSTDPIAFTADGTGLHVVTSHGANAARLVRVDVATGAITAVAEDEAGVYDVAGAYLHPDTREPQFAVILRARAEYEVLDDGVAGDLRALQALDGGDLVLQGRDHADKTWLAGFTNDDGPIRYFAYDREKQKGTFLFEHQPALSRYRLAEMEPFSLTSRDGLELHGYATFPPDVAPADRRNLPTVLNVHGGPWHRDSWGFNPEAQWFATRGYVCLQVNFRGSTGYGKAFLNAGNREWGAKMHDDLIDTVGYAIDQGWADADRVAIYGGSYGGYAALVGATFTPDVFCCAIDIVGPSNLETLIRSIPPYWAPMLSQFHNRVGNPDTEPEFMWSRSPLSRIADIRIPLLIAQGANDPRVKQAESEQIVAALKDKGIEHEYMLFPDEGHGFAKPENRMRFYTAAEKFLAQHLGAGATPV
jgi:dipeptidyl aminopeptidase/acylaminoacyl peptidase